MKITYALTMVAAGLIGTSAFAGSDYKTVYVQVKDLVPVQVQKTVEKEVQVTEYEQVEKQVPVTINRTFWEDQVMDGKKQVWVDEEYTVNVVNRKIVEEQKTRKVCEMVPVMIEKEVEVCTYVESCDPCSGKTIKTPVTEKKKIQCQVMQRIEKDVPYVEKKCVEEIVPTKQMRKVCKWEPTKVTLKVAVCKPVQEMRTVKVCEPKLVMKKIQEIVCETQYKEVVKCVETKVPVCEPVPACGAVPVTVTK